MSWRDRLALNEHTPCHPADSVESADSRTSGPNDTIGAIGSQPSAAKAPVYGTCAVTAPAISEMERRAKGRALASWSNLEEERAAIVEHDGGNRQAWAEALARLDPVHPPCDIPSKRWLQFIDDCGRFLDEGWAPCAEALGWSAFDLFGCDRLRPFARIDHAGLLWFLNGSKLAALTRDIATIVTLTGTRLTYRRRRFSDRLALAWELEAIVEALWRNRPIAPDVRRRKNLFLVKSRSEPAPH